MKQTLIDPRAAAELLGVSRSFLAKQRMKGLGPPFVRISAGAIRYAIEDLEQWLRAQRVAPAETDRTAKRPPVYSGPSKPAA